LQALLDLCFEFAGAGHRAFLDNLTQAIGSRARNGQECSDGPQGRNWNQPAKGQAEENVM
jgi:hypothetical protein